MNLPIKITDRAWTEILNIRENKGIPEGYGLRITLDASGCAGVNYRIGFDTSNEEDQSYSKDDLSIYIKKKDFMFLIGLKLDYVSQEDIVGFTFLKTEN